MGLIDIIEGASKLAKDVAVVIEREQQKSQAKTESTVDPQSAHEIHDLRKIIAEGREENRRLQEYCDRREDRIRVQVEMLSAIRHEVEQERSARKAAEAKINQLAAETQKPSGTSDTKLQAHIEAHMKALEPAWERLNKRPLPTSSASFARRLNEFAKVVGLDATTGTIARKPAKGKKR